MRIGLIGAGNMASALARGLGEPVLVADPQHDRAERLANELGGEAVASNAEVAERADAIVLCHKPAQLGAVAGELSGLAKAVVSILGGVSITSVEAAYPDVPVYRLMPNVAAEVRRGVFCWASGSREGPERELKALFERAGVVIALPDALIEPATALMGCGPALFALVVEALVDAGVRHGLDPASAARMTVETMAGAAALLADEPLATGQLRRRVTSPGGSTARAVEALERGRVRAAFADAVEAVVA
jgi:pyrroline-5-carboxylate reductase